MKCIKNFIYHGQKKTMLKGGFFHLDKSEIPTFQGLWMSNISSEIWLYNPLKSDFISLLAVELFIFKVKIFTPFGWFC